MITKRQLIEMLEALDVPDDTPVVTPGFDELNWDHIGEPQVVALILNEHEPGHGGEHIKPDGTDSRPTTKCVAIDFE